MEMERCEPISSLLSEAGVLVTDKANVISKLTSLHQGTSNKLQIVSDFDLTLTSYQINNGEKTWSSFGALENYDKLSCNFLQTLDELRERYAPVDADPLIGKEEKVRLIKEWNRKATQVYVSERINRQTIRDAVSKALSKVKLRHGLKTLVEKLADSQVPLLVLSAGLGDAINLILEKNEICSNYLTVISNYLLFDDEGCIKGFPKPLITTGSKGNVSKMQAHCQYFESVSERRNIIILGDRVEDTHVVSCFDGRCDTVVTIGFLNDKVEEQKELYLRNYDIVLLGDPNLLWIQMLVDAII